MSKSSISKRPKSQIRSKDRSLDETFWGSLLIFISCLILIALITYRANRVDLNWLGRVGFATAFSLRYLLGICSYPIALSLGLLGWQKFKGVLKFSLTKGLFLTALWIFCGLILSVGSDDAPQVTQNLANWTFVSWESGKIYLGGVPLYFVYRELPLINLHHLFSSTGTVLLSLSGISLCCVGLSFPKQWINCFYAMLCSFFQKSPPTQSQSKSPIETRSSESIAQKEPSMQLVTSKDSEINYQEQQYLPKTSGATKNFNVSRSLEREGVNAHFTLPPEDLLTAAQARATGKIEEQVKTQATLLEETLLSFGIEAKVGRVHFGPTIISFEVHPAIGVKVQRIKALESDIALNMQARSIRIIAPIPGKAAVGVEVPAKTPQEVGFKELFREYRNSNKRLEIPLLLGKSASGDAVIGDLARMPHLIIAGATGSGKSVCINTIVMSILMNASPEEIRLLMIDPKKVELTAYSELPHMIAPVITEAPGACEALNWLVKEMERRYEMLRRLGLRNIGAFNTRQIDKEAEEATELKIPPKLPYIVGIVDELADLMMSSSSDIETPITRIAQMARAVGIHLILATQRPSREVITGLIKANFPARISFKVANRINSQIILDEVGAESLLGNGDMLFLPPGTAASHRAQGAFMRDEDINRVVGHICKQAPPQYLIASFDRVAQDLSMHERDKPSDPLFDQALQIISTSGLASTTFLQRKLKIGYARAASLMDLLETRGIISGQEGAKPRRVLITSEQKTGKSQHEI